MTPPPRNPKIYHITPVDNLGAIVAEGGLLSDRTMKDRGGPACSIGMDGIKRRRMEELEVSCHLDTKVGDYVPFYFCPRSVMLYVLYRANHPDLSFRGGQEPIVHLECDLNKVIQWANDTSVWWAFSLSNAGARYVEFRAQTSEINQLDWVAINGRDFGTAELKEKKQAEFLLHEYFPFELVERIGVHSQSVATKVSAAIHPSHHKPRIEVIRDWYF